MARAAHGELLAFLAAARSLPELIAWAQSPAEPAAREARVSAVRAASTEWFQREWERAPAGSSLRAVRDALEAAAASRAELAGAGWRAEPIPRAYGTKRKLASLAAGFRGPRTNPAQVFCEVWLESTEVEAGLGFGWSDGERFRTDAARAMAEDLSSRFKEWGRTVYDWQLRSEENKYAAVVKPVAPVERVALKREPGTADGVCVLLAGVGGERRSLAEAVADEWRDLVAVQVDYAAAFADVIARFPAEDERRRAPTPTPPAPAPAPAPVTERVTADGGGARLDDDDDDDATAVAPEAVARVARLARQMGQVILYGPPGTGKTRLARQTSVALLGAPRGVDLERADGVDAALARARDEGRFDLVVFHPAYEYEQFVGGVGPVVDGDEAAGAPRFAVQPGVFLRLARACEASGRASVLLVDEINRGNLPRLLGELVYALEYRTSRVRLPFRYAGDDTLAVPENLYLVATMNSSDRSIGQIDVAVRRRFGMVHVPPDAGVVRAAWRALGEEALGEQLAALMEKVNAALADQHEEDVELGVGQAYFLPGAGAADERFERVRNRWAHQVVQLLREYRHLTSADLRAFEREDLDAVLKASRA